MLSKIVILPMALSAVPTDPEAAELFFSSIISALQDFAENCVLVMEGTKIGGRIVATGSLLTALDQWPPKFKIRAQKVLKALETRNRIILEDGTKSPCKGCSIPVCSLALGAAVVSSAKYPLDLILAGGPCVACSGTTFPQITLGASRYFVSEFSRKRRSQRTLLLGDAEIDATQLEKRFLEPVFTCAEVLKLYDRLIGQKILPREAAKAGASTRDIGLPENYRLTLEWLVRSFARYSCASMKLVELYTTVDYSYMDKNHIQRFERSIREFIDAIENTSGIRIRVYIKQETEQQKMVHGRYLLTDKIGFLVERGFDLLWSTEQMAGASSGGTGRAPFVRDVMISICPAAERIESLTARLRDHQVF